MKTAAKDFKMTELGPIPKDWEVKRLGEVAPLQRGFDLPTAELKVGPYPVVYSNGIGNYHCKAMCDAPGLVTGRSGTIGRFTYIAKGRYWPHNTALWVTSFNGNHPLFVKYLYETLGFENFSTGTGVPTLNRNIVHDYSIPVPPLPEQRKIAAALSDVDEMIAALEKLIEKKRKIKTGAMQRLLTAKTRLPGFKGAWVEKRLGECGYGVRGVGYKPWQSGFTPMVGRVSLLKSNNVQDGRLNFNDIVYVDECCVSEEQRMRVGDVLICAANGSRNLVGKAAPLLVEREVTFGAFMSVFRCHDNDQAAFVGHLLNSGAYKQKLDDILTGSAINNLNVSDIEDMRFLIPPTLAEQKAIAKVLGDMDEEIAALEAELAKTRQLKQGMMQELLTGKTRLI